MDSPSIMSELKDQSLQAFLDLEEVFVYPPLIRTV
jgi:hypothetical protein